MLDMPKRPEYDTLRVIKDIDHFLKTGEAPEKPEYTRVCRQ